MADDTLDLLKDLIETCKDGETGYEAESSLTCAEHISWLSMSTITSTGDSLLKDIQIPIKPAIFHKVR